MSSVERATASLGSLHLIDLTLFYVLTGITVGIKVTVGVIQAYDCGLMVC